MNSHNHQPTVFLYTDLVGVFPDYQPRRQLSAPKSGWLQKVSLIATLKNEIGSVQEWVKNIIEGERLPDEIILVDAGSDDGSYETLLELATGSPRPFQVCRHPDANIAKGRNIAIRLAQYPVIACTDLGSRPRKDWLSNLILPFEDNHDIEVVAGWYLPLDRNGRPFQRRRWPRLDQITPDDYLPSSRSLAFKKSAWEGAGGYPEWLTRTGEDTLFALGLKQHTKFWAFVPEAVVEWYAPDELRSYWRKQYEWSIGDGEAALNTPTYRRIGLELLVVVSGIILGMLMLAAVIFTGSWLLAFPLLIFGALSTFFIAILFQRKSIDIAEVPWELGAKFAQLFGYIQGVLNRQKILDRSD